MKIKYTNYFYDLYQRLSQRPATKLELRENLKVKYFTAKNILIYGMYAYVHVCWTQGMAGRNPWIAQSHDLLPTYTTRGKKFSVKIKVL